MSSVHGNVMFRRSSLTRHGFAGYAAPMRSLLLMGLLAATAAHASLKCAPSACSDPSVVADVRAAVRDACPCGAATSPNGYKKCWKPVVKHAVTQRGKTGFAKACRGEITRALASSTCGRKDAVLCRKSTKHGDVCRVTKTSKCATPVDTGEFGSCADTCEQLTAEPFPTTKELPAADVAAVESDEGGVIRFGSAPASLADVDVG